MSGTITTKTYVRHTLLRGLAIEMADGPSGYQRDNDGLYILQDGAPLDTRDYKHTIKVVVIETSRQPICDAGYYTNYATTNAITDAVIDNNGVTWYRLMVSASTRRDALEFYNSIKSGETTPDRRFPEYRVDSVSTPEA